MKDQRLAEVVAAKLAPQTKRGQIEEWLMLTKAALMQHAKELQNIQGVCEQLTMMEKFKSSFVNLCNISGKDGESEYDATICDLLGKLPIMKKQRTTINGGSGNSVWAMTFNIDS